MNTKLGTWYRIADLEPNHESLQKRWQAISSYLDEGFNNSDIISLVRAFFNVDFTSESIDEFSKFIVNSDNAFDIRNKVELSVLAGVALREMIEKFDNKTSSFVFLAIMSASFNNKSAIVPDIQDEIIGLFNDACIKSREELFSTENSKIGLPPTKNILEALKADTAENWDIEMAKMLAAYISGLNTTLNSLVRETMKYDKHTKIYSDDSQILWWLVGKWSNDFHKPYSEINKNEASIYAGKELADLVSALPGPYSAKAVLDQVLSNCKKTKTELALPEIISLVNYEWRKVVMKSYDPSDLLEITPILYAISLSLQADEKDHWIPVFTKATAMELSKAKFEICDVAYQVYIECLVIRAMGEDA